MRYAELEETNGTIDVVSWVFGNQSYDHDRAIYIDVNQPDRTITAKEAHVTVRKLIAGLKANGLNKGDPVCLYAFNDVSMMIYQKPAGVDHGCLTYHRSHADLFVQNVTDVVRSCIPCLSWLSSEQVESSLVQILHTLRQSSLAIYVRPVPASWCLTGTSSQKHQVLLLNVVFLPLVFSCSTVRKNRHLRNSNNGKPSWLSVRRIG